MGALWSRALNSLSRSQQWKQPVLFEENTPTPSFQLRGPELPHFRLFGFGRVNTFLSNALLPPPKSHTLHLYESADILWANFRVVPQVSWLSCPTADLLTFWYLLALVRWSILSPKSWAQRGNCTPQSLKLEGKGGSLPRLLEVDCNHLPVSGSFFFPPLDWTVARFNLRYVAIHWRTMSELRLGHGASRA